MSLSQPGFLSHYFGQLNLSLVNTIPDAPAAPNASWQSGFPLVNMQDPLVGGIPPDGKDMNGVLAVLSQYAQWQSAGGRFKWDTTTNLLIAMNGYQPGMIIQLNDNRTEVICTAANNFNNPNTNMSGWALYSRQAFLHFLRAGPLNVTGSFVMLGLNTVFNTGRSGFLEVSTLSTVLNTATGNQTIFELCYGTGTAPAAGDPQTGTIINPGRTAVSPGAGLPVELPLHTVLPPLTIPQSYWIDISARAVSGTSTIQQTDIVVREF